MTTSAGSQESTGGSGSTRWTSDAVSIGIRTIMIILWVSVGALVALHLISQGAAAGGLIRGDGRIASVFNMDAESSIPTWFSMLLLALVGLAQIAVYLVLRARAESPRAAWLLLGIAFLFVSLDEGSALHEHLTTLIRALLGVTSGPLYYAWVIPYVIALLVAAPFLFRFFVRLPVRTRLLMLLAAALYLGGAVGVELVSGSIAGDEESSLSGVMWLLNAVEEGLEMSGVVVFAYAVMTHYRDDLQRAGGARVLIA